MKAHDWWGSLCVYYQENRRRPREYGIWDCWQFVGGGVLVMTGIDHRERFPSYASLEEGLQVLANAGGPVAILTELFGPSKPVAFAQRGDIVLCDLGEGPAGGLCFGLNTMTVSPAGIEPVKTLAGIAAWTV